MKVLDDTGSVEPSIPISKLEELMEEFNPTIHGSWNDTFPDFYRRMKGLINEAKK